MSRSFFKGVDTYVVFAEDSAFGTPGTPTGSDYVDKVSTFSSSVTNNMIRTQGIGEGRNATGAVNGMLDCSGSMEWELTDPDFLQYGVIGTVSGSGTAADPYELKEVDEIGYSAGQVKTLTLEVGSNGGANDDCMTYDGVVFNTCTVTATQGETIKVSGDWVGRTVTSSTSILSYTPPTNRPFTFIDGSASVGSDKVGALTGLTITIANNIFTYGTLGSRLIEQPVAMTRRYDLTLTMKLHYDDAASVLSGLEARGLVFNGTTSGTTPNDTAENASTTLSLDLVEGSNSGDRVVNFDFEKVYFESCSSPVALDDGVFEVTINCFALSGLADGSDKVPVRWYTLS